MLITIISGPEFDSRLEDLQRGWFGETYREAQERIVDKYKDNEEVQLEFVHCMGEHEVVDAIFQAYADHAHAIILQVSIFAESAAVEDAILIARQRCLVYNSHMYRKPPIDDAKLSEDKFKLIPTRAHLDFADGVVDHRKAAHGWEATILCIESALVKTLDSRSRYIKNISSAYPIIHTVAIKKDVPDDKKPYIRNYAGSQSILVKDLNLKNTLGAVYFDSERNEIVIWDDVFRTYFSVVSPEFFPNHKTSAKIVMWEEDESNNTEHHFICSFERWPTGVAINEMYIQAICAAISQPEFADFMDKWLPAHMLPYMT